MKLLTKNEFKNEVKRRLCETYPDHADIYDDTRIDEIIYAVLQNGEDAPDVEVCDGQIATRFFVGSDDTEIFGDSVIEISRPVLDDNGDVVEYALVGYYFG